MKRIIITAVFFLTVLTSFGQALPSNSVPFGTMYWIAPDGSLWGGTGNNAYKQLITPDNGVFSDAIATIGTSATLIDAATNIIHGSMNSGGIALLNGNETKTAVFDDSNRFIIGYGTTTPGQANTRFTLDLPTGDATFSGTVSGADGVADNDFATVGQIPAIASQNSGLVRLIESPNSGIFNFGSSSTGSDLYLRIGTTSNEYEYTIPANTFPSNLNKGVIRLKMVGNMEFRNSSDNITLYLNTADLIIVEQPSAAPLGSKWFESEVTLVPRASPGLWYYSVKCTIFNSAGAASVVQIFSGSITPQSSYTDAITVKLRHINFAPTQANDVNILPLTIEAGGQFVDTGL